MKFNPFEEKPRSLESIIMDFNKLNAKSYDKLNSSPYTRVRCILMNGTEYESVWLDHQFHRHCDDNDLRRSIALIRRSEQQQQKLISSLKPIDENLLETTIGYEQLAVDLTAFLAQNVKDRYIKKALDFALLEDFDHLYRYANLLESDMKAKAEDYVGDYTEIMPARPTIAHHRHPFDSVKRPINNKTSTLFDKCAVNIITAAEQQTMNYYMNLGGFYKNQKGREIYSEIAMVEEDHVTHYGSLIDPHASFLEMSLMHEYTECYLYYSMMCDESDEEIKKIWEMLLNQEIAHLHVSAQNLYKYEKKHYSEILPDANFPILISFKSNKDYIRKIIQGTITNTGDREEYIEINNLPDNADFFKYQKKVIKNPEKIASHKTIVDNIRDEGSDYRVMDKPHPIKSLQDRKVDNVDIGRIKYK